VPRHWITFVLALTLAALAGCGRLGLTRPVAGNVGPYFSTKLCGVQIDGKAKVARLHLTLAVVQPLPRGALVETEFQDIANRTVLTASRVAAGSERTLELLSPPVSDVRPRGYETVTRVYAAADRKQVLGTHTYVCESLIDQRELGPEFR